MGSDPVQCPINHRRELDNWVSGTGGAAAAFDFTTKGVLQSAVNNELWREIKMLSGIRVKNGIKPGSSVEIVVADKDLYVAKIDGKVITKIGSRFDAGGLIPPGFRMVTSGKDYAVWEMV
ncbi:hypothetical protein EJ110_NYTH28394 [Nymphaea thermarum]|nr:hypothetical protein EJ110_NYTH28394 [Nymphaea thermarum]